MKNSNACICFLFRTITLQNSICWIIKFSISSACSSSLTSVSITTLGVNFLAKLSAFTNKGGIVGVRANLLYADLLYKQDKFADAIPYFEKVASLKPKAHTAPLALYNAAVCYEETGNVEKACELYKQVSENKDFFLMAHAKFSYGRILESQGKYKEAVEVYSELNDALPYDTWSNLAKTRILDLQISGKVE